jgi:hypothetical protein
MVERMKIRNFLKLCKSRDGSVGIVTGLLAGRSGF